MSGFRLTCLGELTKLPHQRNLQGDLKQVARPAWRGGLSQPWLPKGAQLGVEFLARIIRYFLWLVFFAWIAWLVRRLVGAANQSQRRVSTPAAPAPPVRLYRDPWCGTHVSPEISYTLEDSGAALHFCSAECRERYCASMRRAAGG
jgi:YHS domain-containing protein